jgi:hypothetical protein
MTNSAWIAIIVSVLALVVTTLVNLSIAAMNRKQMRQIELHRADPSIPLLPPPHPATTFFKTNTVFILSLVWNCCWLVRELTLTTPVTRADILAITMLVGSTYFLVTMQMTSASMKTDRVANAVTFDKIATLFERILKKD